MSAFVLDATDICDCHVTPPGPRPMPGDGRMVLVQPDDSDASRDLLIETLAIRPRDQTRAIAMVGLITPEATLAHLRLSGVCGLRVHLAGPDAEGAFHDACERARPQNWLVQAHATQATIAALAPVLHTAPVAVLLEGLFAAGPPDPPSLGAILELLAAGRVWVQFQGNDPTCLPAMRTMLATNPDRIVWGSHWPKNEAPKNVEPENGAPKNNENTDQDLLHLAIRQQEVLHRVLVTNPYTLFGFAPVSGLWGWNAARVG